MFLELFYGLRAEGVPVSIHEWQTLLSALDAGLHGSSLLRFYHLARACLIKSETYFDAYDRVFLRVFKGVEGAFGDAITDEILDWLRDPKNFPRLTAEEFAELERLTGDDLMRRFLETLAEQDGRHDGGSRWIGTGGRSPFGHGGQHPTGIRVGGPGRNRSAMKVAEARRFVDYRTDVRLDARQLRLAFRRLRQLTRSGSATELDLGGTINATCRNAGEIELVFRPPRRNNVRVLLLMDVGGTMAPYVSRVSELLTVLCGERSLRAFDAYYFHNCVYDKIYRRARMRGDDAMATAQVLRSYDASWKLVIVGDAAMHPAELLDPYGGVDPRVTTKSPGIVWLKSIASHFERRVWINPEPVASWEDYATIAMIRRIFPMFHLSVDGLADAVKALVGTRVLAA